MGFSGPRPHRTVLLSGGLDSTTLLASLISKGYRCEAISIDYHQRHVRELEAAQLIASHYGTPLIRIGLKAVGSLLSQSGSSQVNTDVPVPHGHYEAPNMKVTVVPNRNMMMISIAAARAITNKSMNVAYAAHAGDHAIYPDCRVDFITAMRVALRLCHFDIVDLDAPFVLLTKAQIVSLGNQLHVPYHLTYSCYEGNAEHCGKCGTCVERKEAFQKAGVVDPTKYTG